MLADLARQFVATGFPWNPLGSVWEFPGLAGDVMIQPASLVGVHGLTLATILLASTAVAGLALARVPGWQCWRCGAASASLRLDQPMPPAPT